MNDKRKRPLSSRAGVVALLAAAVVLAHVLLTGAVLQEMQGLKPADASIKRMDATYVSEVRLTEPPAAPPAPAMVQAAAPQAAAAAPKKAKPKPTKPPKVAKAASQPDEAASKPEVLADAASATQPSPEPAASAAATSALAASASANAPASTANSAVAAASVPSMGASGPNSGRAFVWPQATKVSYKLEGYFRGPVSGQASVEWVRQDSRYQVHIDASIGPSFAPLGSWRLTSEGEIQPQGLHPKLYENTNRLLIKTSAPRLIKLEEDEVTHPDGKRYPRPPEVQDPASFMIQLAYQFTLRPDLLKPGSSFALNVVTLRKLEQLTFDVVGNDVVRTPIGDVPTVHVRPRKTVTDGGALPADVWFAPGLQYLPVRIYIKMSDDVYMDMQMNRAPQQAPGEGAPPAP
ncbi:uncharacterized protein DUF3108 [Aquabacterium commune]|uniref:Uncharacterized protein DUF3108 n=1 Tax=Aquabacterium commune TaxID=70586 RepID=A0A4R6REV0_9BURK|nr:DUF3108 domain-containing protein [Aquabacterium commune]TDP84694.1 uncharacterized protein DUF3108 [Aquabacterium commune]